jgi:hypothetical protein
MYTTLLSLTAYKYAPNLESLLTQQYVCVICTLWSDNTCVFTCFYSIKNANTQLIWSSEYDKLRVWSLYLDINICVLEHQKPIIPGFYMVFMQCSTLSGSPKPVSSKNYIGLVVWCCWWPDWSSEFENSQV